MHGLDQLTKLAASTLVFGIFASGGAMNALAKVTSVASPLLASVNVDEVRHGHVDRMVVWLKSDAGLVVSQQGDTLLLTWPGSTTIAAARPAVSDATAVGHFGQWIKGFASQAGRASIQLAPGAHTRLHRWATRMWIDVDGGETSLSAGQFVPVRVAAIAAAPASAPSEQASFPSAGHEPDAPQSRKTTQSAVLPLLTAPQRQISPSASPLQPGMVEPGMLEHKTTASLATPAVVIVAAPSGLSGLSVSLPVSAASAGFTRSGQIHVVFDAPVALDLTALKDDPNFGGVVERLLPNAAVIQFRPPMNTWPQLTRSGEGWVLTLATTPVLLAARDVGHANHGELDVSTVCPGNVVTIDDEATGERLLVGTERCAHVGLSTSRQTSEFTMLPSWQGVVIAPASDRVRLHVSQSGFTLDAVDPPALNFVWQNVGAALRPDGREMTWRFDFPALSSAVLRRRLDEALRDAARAPRSDRLGPRLRVAQAMLAGGLDSEALAVLRVASTDDPSSLKNGDLKGLAAIASWLVGRAGGEPPSLPRMDTSSLGDSDETTLWRAIWSSDADRPAAAALIAPRWRLLMDYPAALRRALLPTVASVLQQGGQDAALTKLLADVEDDIPALDLIRAAEMDRHGQISRSLTLLDQLGAGRDRWVRAQAQQAATEERLAHHVVTPAVAAAQLDKQIYGWRGGAREANIRLRAAELHAQSGDWRAALALLEETDALYPDLHAQTRAAQLSIVGDLLHGSGPARMSALDVFALANSASKLLGSNDADVLLAPLLADRLLSLDLPERAEPILHRLLDHAGSSAAASGLGLRLAGLIADRGACEEAIGVLEATGQAPTDEVTRERRAVLKASLLAKSGHPQDALSLLSGFNGQEALLLVASIDETVKDYASASRALSTIAKSRGFTSTPASSQRDVILRAVRDDAETGNLAALRLWRAGYTRLFAGQPDAGLFDVLTAEPVSNVADLGRADRELAQLQALPASLALPNAR